MARRSIEVGLAGLGNVGMGVYVNLAKNATLLAGRCQTDLRIRRIAVRDLSRQRAQEIPADLLTDSWQDLIDDDAIQIIVELIGGINEARALVMAALRKRKVVVTGNKALLAEHGREIFALAEEMGVPVYFEAAVAGGIPIIKTIQESLIGNRIKSIYGIINGTCNYILSRMREAGLGYEDALKEAQELGYAESDPTLDVNGWDAGHKAILLASLVCGRWIQPEQVYVEGIEKVTLADMHFVRQLGYDIKLLAVIRCCPQNITDVRVQPSLISADHLLAAVHGVHNAVLVNGDLVGETLYYGRGAGQDPTSSSVISDLVDAACCLNRNDKRGFIPSHDDAVVKPVDETLSRYYLRLSVVNQPGVLAQVATITGNHNIGITSVMQPESSEEVADLVLMTDTAPFGAIKRAMADLRALACTREDSTLLRMENLNGC